jgi:hypothetical protein
LASASNDNRILYDIAQTTDPLNNVFPDGASILERVIKNENSDERTKLTALKKIDDWAAACEKTNKDGRLKKLNVAIEEKNSSKAAKELLMVLGGENFSPIRGKVFADRYLARINPDGIKAVKNMDNPYKYNHWDKWKNYMLENSGETKKEKS